MQDAAGLETHLRQDAAAGSVEPSAIPLPGSTTKDRIVVLGRPQAGKTIFLASLYLAGWNRTGDVQIEAMNGRTHKAVMETVETLKAGKWPSSTTGSKYFDLSVRLNGFSKPLVSLDYPGEVFRKAFIDGSDTDDVGELLEHIDRAVAAIVLLDPAVVEENRPTVAMDDNYGMAKAIERIRSWPGGESVPIAIVLTKHDQHRQLIREHGGATAYVNKRYRSLVRAAGQVAVFSCSVVHESRDPVVPDRIVRTFTPDATLAPLRWVFEMLIERESVATAAAAASAKEEWLRNAEVEARVKRQRSLAIWLCGWFIFIGILGGAGFIAWKMGRPPTAGATVSPPDSGEILPHRAEP